MRNSGVQLSETESNIGSLWRKAYELDPETIRLISHSKRFLERWAADQDFQNEILTGNLSLERAQSMCGCEIDVKSLLPVFHPGYTDQRVNRNKTEWFLTGLWDSHLSSLLKVRDSVVSYGDSGGSNRQFDIWRNRNINRSALQLDFAAAGITHPPVAFELSSGCSVGCWFCGISAEKFKGHFSLKDGGDLEWRDTLEAVKSFLGRGIQCGFCYWATDPLDNPEYIGFLKIFEDVTGSVPQTTTAIALRDLNLTREVIDLWESRRTTPNRFSVMTLRQLKEIHSSFTPEELFGVEVILQSSGPGSVTKFAAGRNFNKINRKDSSLDGTIACVTGFLINIVEKTVKLISPTMPSVKWPNGYIVFDEKKYDNALSLKSTLSCMLNSSVRASMFGDYPVRITEGGLYNRDRSVDSIMFRRIEISNPLLRLIGDKLSDGVFTPIQIADYCVENGISPLIAIASIEKLWQEGVIDQDFCTSISH